MNKLATCVILIFAIICLTVASVYAQDNGGNIFQKGCIGNDSSSLCEEAQKKTDPLTGSGGVLNKIISLVLFALGVASVIMIIVGGFKYMLSGGDGANTKSAKNTILYAIIGLVIAVAARPLITFVVGRF